MEAAMSLLYSTSSFHARAIARSCLPFSSPAASPAGSATLVARTSPVSVPLQEQHDAPSFRMLNQDTIRQVKCKARTAVKEKREKNLKQTKLLFQDQHGHLPTLRDSQGFNRLSAGMDQSELTTDNELSNAVDLAKKALSASNVAAISADLELLGAKSDGADLVDHKIGEVKMVRSARLLEMKSKRRKTPISNILVPETHNSRRVHFKKKQGFNNNKSDPFMFMWGPETNQLLTAEEEYELFLHIQVMLKLEQLKSKLESRFRREPTLIEWAEAADLSRRVLKDQLHVGNRSREKVIKANLRLVVFIAKRFQGRGLDMQDLMQSGSLGLIKSVEKFNPVAGGCRFGTYAYWWILKTVWGAMVRYSRLIRLPDRAHRLLIKIAQAKRLYDQEGVRIPSNEQIAERVGITVEKLDRLLCMARFPISLQQTVWADGKTTYQEITADPEVELPEVAVTKQLMKLHVLSLLSILNPRERRIIMLRYGIDDGRGKSLSEIGDVFGLTRERVRQLEKVAFGKLKECATTKGLDSAAYREWLV